MDALPHRRSWASKRIDEIGHNFATRPRAPRGRPGHSRQDGDRAAHRRAQRPARAGRNRAQPGRRPGRGPVPAGAGPGRLRPDGPRRAGTGRSRAGAGGAGRADRGGRGSARRGAVRDQGRRRAPWTRPDAHPRTGRDQHDRVGRGRDRRRRAPRPRRWPRASLVGIETDPAAALVARANLAAAGLAGRSRVVLADYRTAEIPPPPGRTLYLGNPPYVRHHQIPAAWKAWLARTAGERGLAASALAGLHAHFFLATACHAAPGDLGAFITAAEWLDVNYGRLVRALMLGPLGGESVHLIEPAVPVFSD